MLTFRSSVSFAGPTMMIAMDIVDLSKVLGTVFYSFTDILRVIYFAQLIIACMIIRERFEKLNEKINKFDSTGRISFNRIQPILRYSATGDIAKTQDLGKLFHSLCDGIEIVNQTFTPHFILLVSNALVSFVASFE